MSIVKQMVLKIPSIKFSQRRASEEGLGEGERRRQKTKVKRIKLKRLKDDTGYREPGTNDTEPQGQKDGCNYAIQHKESIPEHLSTETKPRQVTAI